MRLDQADRVAALARFDAEEDFETGAGGVDVGDVADVRVADGAGKPTGLNETIPGRLSRDGKLYLKARIIDKAEGRVYVQAHRRDGKLAWETPLNLGRPVLHLLLLDSDLQAMMLAIITNPEEAETDMKSAKG